MNRIYWKLHSLSEDFVFDFELSIYSVISFVKGDDYKNVSELCSFCLFIYLFIWCYFI